jgi:hypothetical protein
MDYLKLKYKLLKILIFVSVSAFSFIETKPDFTGFKVTFL